MKSSPEKVMGHTEGRLVAEVLRVTINGVQKEYHCIGLGGTNKTVAITGEVGGEYGDEISQADARRLVACWNAMDGIDDPELWVAQMRHMDGDHTISCDIIQEMQKERGELVKALDILERLSGIAMMEDDPVRVAARAILARYDEKQQATI